MDIEKLKEDIRNLGYDLEYGEEQNQGRIAVNVNCLRSVIDFANEAIARQSVKSEDVAEAIEYYKSHLAERLRDGKDEVTKRFETIITALYQDQLPLAIQWTGKNLREVIDLVGLNPSANKWTWTEYEQVVSEKGLKIFTPDGSVMVDVGDWIIQNGKDCYVTRQTGYKSRTRADKQVVARRLQWSDVEQEAYHEWLNTPDHGQD